MTSFWCHNLCSAWVRLKYRVSCWSCFIYIIYFFFFLSFKYYENRLRKKGEKKNAEEEICAVMKNIYHEIKKWRIRMRYFNENHDSRSHDHQIYEFLEFFVRFIIQTITYLLTLSLRSLNFFEIRKHISNRKNKVLKQRTTD